MQKNFASALANITEQYYLLVSAHQTYDFLKKNDAVTIGLNHLQEVLVKAGILNPYELEDAENLENLEKLMQRAEKTFTTIVNDYFPFLASPVVDKLYEATKEYSSFDLPQIEKPLIPNPNTVTAAVFGKLSIGLSQIMQVEVEDLKGNDYPNDAWKIRAKPTTHEFEPKEVPKIEPPFSLMWLQNKKFLVDSLSEIKNVSKSADLEAACNLIYGLGNSSIYDPELLDILSGIIEDSKETADIDVLANAIYGLGMVNSHPNTMKTLVDLLASSSNLEEIGFFSLIKCMWGQCVHKLYTPEFFKFVEIFNTFEVRTLSKRESLIFKEVILSLELELKITNLNYAITLAKSYAMNDLAQGFIQCYNPIKPLLRKTGRYIMQQGITEEEARLVHKKILDTEKFPIYKCDDVIALNGKLVHIFYVGDEGIYNNHVLGNYQLKARHFECLDMRALPLPIYEILNIDPYLATVTFKSIEPINEYVNKFVGIPKNHLETLDYFTSELMKFMRDDYSKVATNTQTMLLLEELLGAYKVQSLSRLKPGKYLHSQGLEEIKIQLYKVHSRFQILEEDSKEAIDKIVKKTTSEASFSDLIQNVNKSIEINNVQKAEF